MIADATPDVGAAHRSGRTALPADFRWGVATSAFQVEGAASADGRLPSIWDDFCRVPNAVDGGDDGTVACDSYHRWPDDLALLRRLGVGDYRFSIAWPRVQPLGSGAVNAPGLDYYDRMVDDLLAVGIRPLPTLYHWDLPSALQERGGWVARDTAARLADYAGVVARRLGDRVTEWCTVNEPFCCAWKGYLEGAMAPGHRDWGDAVRASHHLLLGHALATAAVRAEAAAPASIGIVLNPSPCEPASDAPADVRATERADGHLNRWWLDPLHGRGYPADMVQLYGIDPPVAAGDLELIATPQDFMGVNYYFRMIVAADDSVATLGFRQVPVSGVPVSALGWELRPQGLRAVLVRIAKEYDPAPMIVTESGAAFEDVPDESGYVHDDDRARYLAALIDATGDAVSDGADVRGYFAWSLLDNFEWAYGYRPRFGLARVDYATGRRTLKHSGEAYAELIRAQA